MHISTTYNLSEQLRDPYFAVITNKKRQHTKNQNWIVNKHAETSCSYYFTIYLSLDEYQNIGALKAIGVKLGWSGKLSWRVLTLLQKVHSKFGVILEFGLFWELIVFCLDNYI